MAFTLTTEDQAMATVIPARKHGIELYAVVLNGKVISTWLSERYAQAKANQINHG